MNANHSTPPDPQSDSDSGDGDSSNSSDSYDTSYDDGAATEQGNVPDPSDPDYQ